MFNSPNLDRYTADCRHSGRFSAVLRCANPDCPDYGVPTEVGGETYMGQSFLDYAECPTCGHDLESTE